MPSKTITKSAAGVWWWTPPSNIDTSQPILVSVIGSGSNGLGGALNTRGGNGGSGGEFVQINMKNIWGSLTPPFAITVDSGGGASVTQIIDSAGKKVAIANSAFNSGQNSSPGDSGDSTTNSDFSTDPSFVRHPGGQGGARVVTSTGGGGGGGAAGTVSATGGAGGAGSGSTGGTAATGAGVGGTFSGVGGNATQSGGGGGGGSAGASSNGGTGFDGAITLTYSTTGSASGTLAAQVVHSDTSVTNYYSDGTNGGNWKALTSAAFETQAGDTTIQMTSGLTYAVIDAGSGFHQSAQLIDGMTLAGAAGTTISSSELQSVSNGPGIIYATNGATITIRDFAFNVTLTSDGNKVVYPIGDNSGLGQHTGTYNVLRIGGDVPTDLVFLRGSLSAMNLNVTACTFTTHWDGISFTGNHAEIANCNITADNAEGYDARCISVGATLVNIRSCSLTGSANASPGRVLADVYVTSGTVNLYGVSCHISGAMNYTIQNNGGTVTKDQFTTSNTETGTVGVASIPAAIFAAGGM